MLMLMPTLMLMLMPMPMPTLTLMLMEMPMLTQMLMLMEMPMLIQVIARLITDLLITITVADATKGAPTATLWTTAGVHADALESARTATLWITVAASVSPGSADACASPPPNRTTNPTDGQISVHLLTTRGAARSTAATGPAIITNQLQDGWRKWISWNSHHDL